MKIINCDLEDNQVIEIARRATDFLTLNWGYSKEELLQIGNVIIKIIQEVGKDEIKE